MAIFGAGSFWDGTDEQKEDFFDNENYVIGWEFGNARDLYLAVSALRVGDILYLKSNQPGSRSIRVKGIGIVTGSLAEDIFEHFYFDRPLNPEGLAIHVRWIFRDEFQIQIPDDEGRLTNVRAATFYEEYLPFVQAEILARVLPRIQSK